MPDISETLLPRLRARTLPGLALPPGMIVPDYGGGTVANLASQIAVWLGAGPLGGPPLYPELSAPLGDDVRRVVLLVVDALGYPAFRHILQEPGSVWQRLAGAGVLSPLVTVFPATTTAALTSLATGVAPAAHGMLGYEIWLREYGVTANMIAFSPMALDAEPGLLAQAGFDPGDTLNVPILPRHLEDHGAETHAFLPSYLARSGLTRMHLSGAFVHAFHSASDLWPLVRDTLARPGERRQLFWVYWPMVDTLSHAYGPTSEPVEMEVRALGRALEETFFDRLEPEMRAGTAFVLVADHGQVPTPFVPDFDLRRHPEFVELLHMMPTGENRAAYLHCRPGNLDAARTYIEVHWPEHFHAVPQETVLASGLLGAEIDPRTPSRLGDLLVLARGQAYLWWSPKDNRLLGRHGSLTPEEILVPYVAARLDREF